MKANKSGMHWTLSLKIAVVNATFATILGTLAGLALVRFGHFKGRTIFGGMITAPLVMPEVITGLSLLMLFITLKEFIGWPDKRGFTTITIAHITFSMAYVAVIIQSRLAGMGQTFEEAAMDLGAKPLRVLMDITFPLLAPGMLAGWLLSFTLSLDDLVIASFVTGPGSTTLPVMIYSRIRTGMKTGYKCIGDNHYPDRCNWSSHRRLDNVSTTSAKRTGYATRHSSK